MNWKSKLKWIQLIGDSTMENFVDLLKNLEKAVRKSFWRKRSKFLETVHTRQLIASLKNLKNFIYQFSLLKSNELPVRQRSRLTQYWTPTISFREQVNAQASLANVTN